MRYWILLLITLSGCGFGTGEEGFHRGRVIDVSISGWFCKTREGQIMSGTGNSSVKYEFTITNEDAFKKLTEAQSTGKEVNLHYYSPRVFGICSSIHPNFVDSVTFNIGEEDADTN